MTSISRRPTAAADAALMSVAAVWGGSYLAASVMTKVASPTTVLALRFIPALLCLGALALAKRSHFDRRVITVGLIFGALQAVTLTLETTAVQRTSATNAGVLVCLAVVIAPALEGFVSGKPLPRAYFAAAASSVVGVALLIGPHGITSPNEGDVLVLIAACTRAVFMVASSHLTQGRTFDAIALNTVQTALSAIVFCAIAGSGVITTAHHLDAQHWAVLAFLSLGCTFAAFLLQLWGIHHTSASRASLLMGTEPVWALAVGVVIGGNRIGLLAFIGAAIIISSTWWGQRIEAGWRSAQEVVV